MPLFFFDVHDGKDITDTEGSELSDVRAARQQALKLAGQLISDLDEAFWEDKDWRVEVRDEANLILFVLHFIGVDAAAMGDRR